MAKLSSMMKRSLLGILVLIQIAFYPAAALADGAGDPSQGSTDPAVSSQQTPDSTPPDSSSSDPAPTDPGTTTQQAPTSPAPPANTGPSSPPGADSQTYTYNPNTGLWENAYYTWDPVTHQTAPKTPQTYSYNPATGMWDTTSWRYDPASGHYVANTVSVPLPPASPNDPLIANTGPNSTNNVGINNTNNGTFNLFYNTRISNTINSSATSGNASILQNTQGGNALTGNAQDMANLLNLLQSSWDPTMTFTANVNGNVTGDLLLDPNQILNSGPSSQNGIQRNNNNNLDVNVQNNGQIVNNVNLAATSGNAAVSGNTTGGDATSGSADALVNIINMINSSISAGDSFLGVINIKGNLNGDILLPEHMVAQLDTTGPNSLNTVNQTNNTTTNLTSVDNKSIANNTNLSADSGQANVSNNTSAGNAQTGDASTKLNIYNLTGRDIIGDNALLVFVNLAGQWSGLIFDAPAGTNSVLGTGPNSTNTIDANTTNTANINLNTNSSIVNNVTAHAQSGDATVSGNTSGGNAKTGKASASANIVNLINSKLNVDGWFGVLFINVLGSWNGSFGVNTTAGDPVAVAGGSGAASAPASNGVFAFVPHAQTTYNGDNDTSSTSSVLASSDTTPQQPTKPTTSPANLVTPKHQMISHSNWWLIISGFGAGLILLGLDRFITIRRKS